ncbi:MAG TPA: HAD-IA family hydrolase, partial [Candidatus Mediterraneibacter intestinigallinarum]|nr:HAD-IA family hydrolase [Candidatus Mediterraneibacter intestinigallinarum]
EEVLQSFIGPPLKEQFQSVFGLSDEEGAVMVATYREYYGEKGIFENRVYDGVPEVFQKLQKAGVRILMATSKPEKYAKQIAEHFGFSQYFDFIGGACMDGRRTDKHEVIEYVIDSCKVVRENAVMIGDRRHDIIGASKAGIHSIGVLYGYGSREELEKAGADMIAVTPGDILKFVIQ